MISIFNLEMIELIFLFFESICVCMLFIILWKYECMYMYWLINVLYELV